ncbi:uncharacterized protein LOC128708998 [Anopheles marshallii]|uniref:uncharacterized protein LOC128708998 n=1 Tax=Anopheles marshallii TaxID=1521116 RepID=UPI00237BCDF0|nr:uncharacterized protein LOC128708998 [Anopheles marshallii]
MSKAKTNPKKSSKNLRNVLAQPLDVAWPRIPDNEIKRCSRFLQQVERKNIISGCNGVIKLLQNGQVAALFVLDTFNPQIFAKLIIQMARKRNPSVLVLALPSFPADCCSNSVLMAVPKPKENEHSEPVQDLLKWMKDISVRNGYIAKASKTKPKTNRKILASKTKKPIDVPLTDEEVAKLYVFEPRKRDVPDKNQPKQRVAQEMENFISLSDKASSGIVVSKHEYQQQNKPRTKPNSDGLNSFDGSYVPLTVNRVQGNPNRVEHKKKRKIQ